MDNRLMVGYSFFNYVCISVLFNYKSFLFWKHILFNITPSIDYFKFMIFYNI